MIHGSRMGEPLRLTPLSFGRRVYHGSLGEPVCQKRVGGGDTMAGGGKGPNDVVVRRVKEQNERPHYSAEARNSMAASNRDAPPMNNHYAEYCIT